MGWLGAINSIGMAVGAVAFGLMADRVGRKRVFIATLLLFAAASGLSALCVSLSALMALRFFIGMGLRRAAGGRHLRGRARARA